MSEDLTDLAHILKKEMRRVTDQQFMSFGTTDRLKLHLLYDFCSERVTTMSGPCGGCPMNRSGHRCPKFIRTTEELRREYNDVIKYKNNEEEMTEVMETIKDSGDRTQFSSGAVRDMHSGKGRYDLLPMCVIDRLAKHYEAGALKYSDRNWEKGIPAHSFADSAMRHFCKYMDGWDDEDHLIAAIWNLCGLAWTEVKRPEMMDIPARTDLKCCGDCDAKD